jgi:hypothetical protein
MSVEGFTREGVDALRAMLDHAERFLASRMEDPREFALLALARAEVEKAAGLTPPV